MAALHACAARLARRPVRRLRAIATEACRRAANGREFLARVKHETGLAIGVISAREEAELALECCAPLLAGGGRRALLFDIGGGSTELAWVRLTEGRPALIGYDSLPVGVVTLAERWGGAGFTADGFDAMVDEVAARLAAFESVHCIGHEIRNGGVTPAGHLRHRHHAGRHRAGTAALSPPAGGRGGAERGGGRRGAGRPARAGPRGAGAAPLRRAGPGGVRAAGLRGLRRNHPAVAGAAGDGGRSRPARGHAAAHDARRRAPRGDGRAAGGGSDRTGRA